MSEGNANGIRLSAVVMTHPERMWYAQQLRDHHPELQLRIVVDPAPGEDCGALRTARLAWGAVAPGATHHLVLQDDTLLCRSFRRRLEQAITARPDHAISLYTEWGSETSYAVRLAALLGWAWADVLDEYVPTQALVLPAAAAHGFSQFREYEGPFDDFPMRLYLAAAGVPAVMTVPNLAENVGLPSVVGHDFLGERASVCFRTDELDDVCWSTGAATPAPVPVFSFTIGQSYSVVPAGGTARAWRRVSTPAIQPDGPSSEAAFDLGRAMVRRMPEQARVIGPKLLIGLWLTAYALGQAASVASGEPAELDRVLARPTVLRAFATMPQGALRFLVDDHHLAEHSSHLSRLVLAGVRQGYRGPAPIDHQERP